MSLAIVMAILSLLLAMHSVLGLLNNVCIFVIEILEENPQVGVAYCQSHQVDKYNDFVATLHCWTDELDK